MTEEKRKRKRRKRGKKTEEAPAPISDGQVTSKDNYGHVKYFRPIMLKVKGEKKARYCEAIGQAEQGKGLRVLFAGDNYSTWVEHKLIVSIEDAKGAAA